MVEYYLLNSYFISFCTRFRIIDKIGYANIIYGDLTLRINIFIIDYVQCLKRWEREE